MIDQTTRYPLIFLAFGWVKNSNLRSSQLDIEPIQPDWKASMKHLAMIFDDHNMKEYVWEDFPAPDSFSVRFGAPQEHTYQGMFSLFLSISLSLSHSKLILCYIKNTQEVFKY